MISSSVKCNPAIPEEKMIKINATLAEHIRRNEKVLSGITLALCIFIIWSWVFHVLSRSAWNVPLGYGGDAWFAYGMIKAYMEGDIFPILFKFIPTLNAPFVANWNDYPITEDFLFAGIGWLGKLIGLWAAINFMLLLAHLLAGLSFWYVCRELKYKPIYAFAGAIVYAYSHYLMARGLGHVVLSYYWHIPLLLLVISWAYSKEIILFKSRKYTIAIVVSVLCGLQNPYYTGMFLQFLGFGALLHLVRKQYTKSAFPLILMAIVTSSFLLVNADTLIYSLVNGSNASAGGRNLASLEVYGMKIPELFLTPGNHPISSFVAFSEHRYYAPAFVKGEFWSSYLGFSSLMGLILLIGISMYRLLQGKLNRVPMHFWFVAWILLYSVIGGFNLLVGAFGFEYFRATNRYSIFILTISLLFLIRFLSKHSPSKWVIPIAILIVFVGLAEELNARYHYVFPPINPIAVVVNTDKNFAQTVEREMPNSMVFQLPVAGFPEVGPINQMGDYEHFRPFIFTQTLHYSYGSNKGRSDNQWQAQVAILPPSDMAKKLESYGFGVIMINKKGYTDFGKSLIAGLAAAGKSIIADSPDLIAFRLQPSPSPVAINTGPDFSSGWSVDEGDHRWAESSHAKMIVNNIYKQPKEYILTFKLSALTPRVVSISLGTEKLRDVSIEHSGDVEQFPVTRLLLQPGKNIIRFDTHTSPVSPGNGDSRMLSFSLSDLRFLPADNAIFTNYGTGWSGDEGTHRWSESSHAKIVITNFDARPQSYVLGFHLSALSPRTVTVSFNNEKLGDLKITNTVKVAPFSPVRILLHPGENTLSFDTDASPVFAGNGDKRMLSFNVSGFHISTAEDALWPEYGAGWSVDEGTHRWAESSHATITVNNFDEQPHPYLIGFKVAALTPRKVSIAVGDKSVGTIDLITAGTEFQFPRTRIMLQPGKNVISFNSDAKPVIAGNGDKRMLSFRISPLYIAPDKE